MEIDRNITAKQTVLITGVNGGLGLETAKILAQKGFKRIIMGARTLEKAKGAASQLKVSLGTEIIPLGGMDMNQPESMYQNLDHLPKEVTIDIVFLQSGGVFFTENYQYLQYKGKRYEKTIFQNAFGGYLLYAHLNKTGRLTSKARIVFAGGEGARGIKGLIEKPDFKSADDFSHYIHGVGELPKYNPMNAIGVSKLVSAQMVDYLSHHQSQHNFVWFSPGLTSGTNGLAALPPLKRWLMEKVAFGMKNVLGLAQSPSKGARKYADALMGKVGQNGSVLGAPEGKALGQITDQKRMKDQITRSDLQSVPMELLLELHAA